MPEFVLDQINVRLSSSKRPLGYLGDLWCLCGVPESAGPIRFWFASLLHLVGGETTITWSRESFWNRIPLKMME